MMHRPNPMFITARQRKLLTRIHPLSIDDAVECINQKRVERTVKYGRMAFARNPPYASQFERNNALPPNTVRYLYSIGYRNFHWRYAYLHEELPDIRTDNPVVTETTASELIYQILPYVEPGRKLIVETECIRGLTSEVYFGVRDRVQWSPLIISFDGMSIADCIQIYGELNVSRNKDRVCTECRDTVENIVAYAGLSTSILDNRHVNVNNVIVYVIENGMRDEFVAALNDAEDSPATGYALRMLA